MFDLNDFIKSQETIPPEFCEVVDEHFWELFNDNTESDEMKQSKRDILIKALKEIKKEIHKRHSIKELHGIDLANYANKYLSVALDLIYFLFGSELNEQIDWWIFDSSSKEYRDADTNELIANVESAEAFVDYHLKFDFVEETEKWAV